MVELPIDILFSVIEEIGMQERADFVLLWAFYSTCRTLRFYTQTFLFRSLSLSFIEKSKPNSFGPSFALSWEHMQLIVRGNPQVVASVKSLRFRAPSSADMSPEFVSFLSNFTSLETLRCGYEKGCSASWSSLQDPQKRRWESIIQLPSVRTLQILGLAHIPISILFPCIHLRALYIDGFSTLDEPELGRDQSNASHLPLSNLTSVQTAWDIKSLDPLFTIYPAIGMPLVEESSVQDLFIRRIWDGDCSELGHFPSLHSFGVDISRLSESDSLFADFHPASLQSLDCLGLEFRLDPTITTVYPSMALAEASEMQLKFPSLTRVVITMTFDWEEYSTFEDDVKEELTELDQLFTSTSDFPRLHTVTVVLKVYSQDLLEELMRLWVGNPEKIKEYFPLFAARLGCTLLPLIRLSP